MKTLLRLLLQGRILGMAIVCLAPGAICSAQQKEAHPNVLFIAIDDLNDWVGCMKGHPQSRTPNIDRLAERGVLFTNAHCAAPVCLASRTAVLCGRAPDQTGVFSNWGTTRGKAPARELQLPIQFSNAGYETLGAGKLYHEPAPALFDEYFATEQRWSPFTDEQAKYTQNELPSKGSEHPRHLVESGPGGHDWVLPLNGLPSERNANGLEGESFDWGPAEVKDDEMGDVRITDWAIRKLDASHAKPFFLGVGYYRPHIPLFAPQRDFDEYPPAAEIQLPAVIADDLADVGAEGRRFALDPITAGTHDLVLRSGTWKEAVRAYLACVTFVDRQIGRLLEELDRSEFAESTWIILWSDHGWQLGEKEHWGKWTGWRQVTRVPLIIVPPRAQQAMRGKTCAEAVSLLDLYPTLIELCHLPPKEGLSGQSLVPLLREPETRMDRAVMTTFDPGNHALSTRDWRYVRYRTGEEELYDTTRDPHEWRNLAADESQRERLNELRDRHDQMLRSMPSATAEQARPTGRDSSLKRSPTPSL